MISYSIYPKQFNNVNYNKFKINSCFVIMPFSDDLRNTYIIINSIARELGIECTRADDIRTTSEAILNKICTQISQAYYIIVDITNLNPNVFYELGIAHVLRDANKVLIIKEKGTECPSDIKHLHYYEYQKENLNTLKDSIIKFFNENNIFEDLYSLLDFHNLVSKDMNISQLFVEDLGNITDDDMVYLIQILNNDLKSLNSNIVLNLLEILTYRLSQYNEDSPLYGMYYNLIIYIISKSNNIYNITEYIKKVYCDEGYGLTKEYKADFANIVLNNLLYFDITIKWIIEYLTYVSPAEFDIAKYKIEIAIIKCKNTKIDDILICNLTNDNKTLAEHCAKLIKERKSEKAVSTLIDIVKTENNPYLVRSCIDALNNFADKKTLLSARDIINSRQELISKYVFLKKHIKDLDLSIDRL